MYKRKTAKLFSHRYILTPCGICMACRINKATTWADRLIHEFGYWEKASFITITYRDEYLPPNGSLRKSDIQKWIKRVRWHQKDFLKEAESKAIKNDPGRNATRRIWEKNAGKLKYYICGEYGEQTHRPHYHGILFGLSPMEAKVLGHMAWHPYSDYKTFHTDLCVPETIKYVCAYITKKLHGKSAEYYEQNGLEPPFAIMSKGIGKHFAEENEELLREKKSIISDRGTDHPIPRYYRKLLRINPWDLDPEDELKTIEKMKTAKQRELNLVQKSKLKRGKL